MKLLLTKKFAFEMAHALEGYNGKCGNLHGHSYHLEVTVEGPAVDDDGMSIDFHILKDIVQRTLIDRYDHSLVLKKGSRFSAASAASPNLIEVTFNPTTENLLIHFAKILETELPQGTILHSLRLAETDTSVAELLL
mgnify:FL=1